MSRRRALVFQLVAMRSSRSLRNWQGVASRHRSRAARLFGSSVARRRSSGRINDALEEGICRRARRDATPREISFPQKRRAMIAKIAGWNGECKLVLKVAFSICQRRAFNSMNQIRRDDDVCTQTSRQKRVLHLNGIIRQRVNIIYI